MKNTTVLSIYLVLFSQLVFAFGLAVKTLIYQFAFNMAVLITWVPVITSQLKKLSAKVQYCLPTQNPHEECLKCSQSPGVISSGKSVCFKLMLEINLS